MIYPGQGNAIGDEGARLLADALRGNTTLERLNLQFTRLGDEGTRVLADALRGNTVLTRLWLGKNKIGDKGAERLFDGLKGNTTLKFLDISWVQFSAEGWAQLADWLQYNTTLTFLGISNHDWRFGDEEAERLADALRSNTTLLDVYFSGKVLPQLQEILDRNAGLKRYAVNCRQMVFVWCAQASSHLPVEVIELIVEQSVWDHQLLPRELHSFLSAGEHEHASD
eukprot:TRINITY_DN8513_c0_g1_i5.p1 TRINITY_DN8513_c0_g1~~TRINITY_DN8513_c0_g1_i5.p1  ORF type:complete len:225 (-),score=34.85 TRINITY_DN8513_c0_g1_i5:251-925(-)